MDGEEEMEEMELDAAIGSKWALGSIHNSP